MQFLRSVGCLFQGELGARRFRVRSVLQPGDEPTVPLRDRPTCDGIARLPGSHGPVSTWAENRVWSRPTAAFWGHLSSSRGVPVTETRTGPWLWRIGFVFLVCFPSS